MANNNTGSFPVLVVRMIRNRNGVDEIESIVNENRSIYTSAKGDYIKTVSDGNIYLDGDGRAVIAYGLVLVNGRTWVRRRFTPTPEELELALASMLKEWGLRVNTELV